MVEVAKAGSEPVVEVRATECCLHCFQKEYTIHYKMYVREKYESRREIVLPSNLMRMWSRGKL